MIYRNIFFAVIIFFTTIPPALATGVDPFGKLNTAGRQAGLSSGGEGQLLNTIGGLIAAFLGFLGVIALVLVIYAGYLWLTAGGNEDKVEKAKDILKNAVIGLVIITLAYAISAFIISTILSGQETPVPFGPERPPVEEPQFPPVPR